MTMTCTRISSRRRALLIALCLTTMSLASAGSALAQSYPDRPIRIIVPFAAGGGSDVVARAVAPKLTDKLGQSVVVENRTGAGGSLGATVVARAPADGYTLLLGSSSEIAQYPNVASNVPYDPQRDFTPIALLATVPYVLTVIETLPVKSVAELLDLARRNPGQLNYGSAGPGSGTHLAMALLTWKTGTTMTHVPYRGSAPAMTDLLGGQIPLSFDTVVAAVPQIQAGKIKALAVTTARRSSLLPDVPTIAESGYPGFDMGSWAALVGPKGLPADVKARLAAALKTVMEMPAVQDKLKTMGFEPDYHPIEDWTGTVNKDIGRMREIATRAQIKVD